MLNPNGARGKDAGTVVRGSRNEVEKLIALGSALRQDGKSAEAARMFSQIADLLPDDWLAQYNAGAVLFEANRLPESIVRLSRALTIHASSRAFTLFAHVQALLGNMRAARTAYESAVSLEPRDFDANWGLFEVNQLLEDNAAALQHQRVALAERSIVSIAALIAPPRLTILELCIAGTFQANIPLDFILDRNHISVHKLYLGEHPVPVLPPYDIIFNTIADAPNAQTALRAAESFIRTQSAPALNAPQLVAQTARDAIAMRFAGSSTVAVAATVQATRATVHAVRPPFPFLMRPLDSHAGNDLARIESGDALQSYFETVPDVEDFFVTAFIDYRNADGYYRKYRIVFVDGIAYPVHLAISRHWMIHYYNALMAENSWMRDEEHAFMRDLNSVFSGVLAAGLSEIARALSLDYFGIDCSIDPDGRVLLFEASTAMIVHMRDPIELYPYKAKYIPRIIEALERLFDERVTGAIRRLC